MPPSNDIGAFSGINSSGKFSTIYKKNDIGVFDFKTSGHWANATQFPSREILPILLIRNHIS